MFDGIAANKGQCLNTNHKEWGGFENVATDGCDKAVYCYTEVQYLNTLVVHSRDNLDGFMIRIGWEARSGRNKPLVDEIQKSRAGFGIYEAFLVAKGQVSAERSCNISSLSPSVSLIL